MSNPIPADAQPIPEGLVAAIDETVAELQGGVTYVLTAVIFDGAYAARQDIQVLTADRTRPFHWRREGPTNRKAAVELIATHATAIKINARRGGRKAQSAARAELMTELVTELANEGVNHVIIESRGQLEDGRDRSVILNCSRWQTTGTLSYDWRTKAEPLLWYPDAMAGIAREHLIEGQSEMFSSLQKTSSLTEIRYIA